MSNMLTLVCIRIGMVQVQVATVKSATMAEVKAALNQAATDAEAEIKKG